MAFFRNLYVKLRCLCGTYVLLVRRTLSTLPLNTLFSSILQKKSHFWIGNQKLCLSTDVDGH